MKRTIPTLALPAILLIAWWSFLGALAVKTANQPNVSELQLGASQRIVVATVQNTTKESEDDVLKVVVQVEDNALEHPRFADRLRSEPIPGTIEFIYPASLPLPSGRILVPLAFLNGQWQPALVPVAVGKRFVPRMYVYPDSEPTRERCQAIWAAQTESKPD